MEPQDHERYHAVTTFRMESQDRAARSLACDDTLDGVKKP